MEIRIAPTTTACWQDIIQEALDKRNHSITEDLESYLVFLLMRFTKDTNLANSVLAFEYLESQALSGNAKQEQLRDVGDKCLLFGGFYPEQAHKRLVSLEYFVNLGRGAYNQIADQNCSRTYNSSLKINSNNIENNLNDLFYKLAQNFVNLLDVLHQIKTLDNSNNNFLDQILKHEKTKLQQQENLNQRIVTTNNMVLH